MGGWLMDRWLGDGQTDGWLAEQMNGWLEGWGWVGTEQVAGSTERWTGGRMAGGQTDGGADMAWAANGRVVTGMRGVPQAGHRARQAAGWVPGTGR